MEVIIYWVKPESVDLNRNSSLSESEWHKASQFVFDKDRELYLAAHIFLRSILSSFSGIAAKALRFKVSEWGKPSLISDANLCFNLSHADGMVVCAISSGLAVGVDVENYKRPISMESILRSNYSSAETQAVLAPNDTVEQQQFFYRYWTLKESYIKAVGKGLSIPLKQCEFEKNCDEEWKLSEKAQNQLEKASWKFYSDLIDDEWVVSATINTDSLAAEQEVVVRLIEHDFL